jgi:hypothetical protein
MDCFILSKNAAIVRSVSEISARANVRRQGLLRWLGHRYKLVLARGPRRAT